MKIYVVIKAAKETTGEFVFVATEKAFNKQEDAQQWLHSQQIVFEETIGNVTCYCERAVHETELM